MDPTVVDTNIGVFSGLVQLPCDEIVDGKIIAASAIVKIPGNMYQRVILRETDNNFISSEQLFDTMSSPTCLLHNSLGHGWPIGDTPWRSRVFNMVYKHFLDLCQKQVESIDASY